MTSDCAIARLLARLILRDARLSARRIQVELDDAGVRLRGSVRSESERAAAGALAESVPGVGPVRNELRVVPPAHVPDMVVAETLRRALESHPRVVKDSITLSVTDGVVTLTGTVSGDEERWIALDIVLGEDGVRDVQDRLVVDVLRQIEDAFLARRVKLAILQALGNGAQIRVASSCRTLVLSGCVSRDELKQTAETVARRFDAGELRNEIRVATSAAGGGAASDARHER